MNAKEEPKPGVMPHDVKQTLWIAIAMLGTVLVAAMIFGGVEVVSMVVGALGELFLIVLVAVGAYTFGVFHRSILDERKKRLAAKQAEAEAAAKADPKPTDTPAPASPTPQASAPAEPPAVRPLTALTPVTQVPQSTSAPLPENGSQIPETGSFPAEKPTEDQAAS